MVVFCLADCNLPFVVYFDYLYGLTLAVLLPWAALQSEKVGYVCCP